MPATPPVPVVPVLAAPPVPVVPVVVLVADVVGLPVDELPASPPAPAVAALFPSSSSPPHPETQAAVMMPAAKAALRPVRIRFIFLFPLACARLRFHDPASYFTPARTCVHSTSQPFQRDGHTVRFPAKLAAAFPCRENATEQRRAL
jgi:hypothetical protein